MTSGELMQSESKNQELSILREFVEIIAEMDCLVAEWADGCPEDCGCPPCVARECLETVKTMYELMDRPHDA